MNEILLVRHAKSYANVRDMAFGNVESPLNQERWIPYELREKAEIFLDLVRTGKPVVLTST